MGNYFFYSICRSVLIENKRVCFELNSNRWIILRMHPM